jgi:hypothetical protein
MKTSDGGFVHQPALGYLAAIQFIFTDDSRYHGRSSPETP